MIKAGFSYLKLTAVVTVAVVMLAGLVGVLSFSSNTTKTLAATSVAPVQGSCNVVTVTNIQSQSIALNAGVKITVDWSFTPPAGDGGCVKVDNFEVNLEVTRRSGRKNTRKIDASSTARQITAEFTDVVDGIKSAKVVVTARLADAKGEKTQSGL